MIDGKKNFSALDVKFKKDGKSVVSITDEDEKKEVESSETRTENFKLDCGGRRRSAEKPSTFNDLPATSRQSYHCQPKTALFSSITA